jgi:hypothetical protein
MNKKMYNSYARLAERYNIQGIRSMAHLVQKVRAYMNKHPRIKKQYKKFLDKEL